MAIRAIEDHDILRQYLTGDRIGCAYLLGCLDSTLAEWSQWWGVFDDETGELQLILLYFTGMSAPLVMTMGEASCIDELLVALHMKIPAHFRCLIEADHRDAFASRYDVDRLHLTTRLALHREDHDPMPDDPFVVRLNQRHIPMIQELLAESSRSIFEPYQLESDMCFGFFDQAGGNLVSLSSVQLMSEHNDVACLGQIYTLEKYRRMGLAFRVVGRQLKELFGKVSLVAMNVPEDNEAALELYDCHNFEFYESYWEGMVRLSY